MKKTGQVHIHFDTVTSTNDFAIQLLSKTNPIDGTAISADLQTEGRGQFDRKWQGDKSQNIALTVIHRPDNLKVSQQFSLNKAISLSVYSLIAHYLPSENVSIKWPNDIYVENSKIAGILIQNILQGSKIKYSIIGMGINIFQKKWPNIHDITPTSLNNYDISIPSTQTIIQKLFTIINIYMEILSKDEYASLNNLYNDHLYKRNEEINYLFDNRVQSGILRSVDNNGRLIIEGKSGYLSFDHGSIKFINQ